MNKDNLQSQGFSNFDWINSAFSAHPKVDPDNGDIFNIGTNTGSVELMKATKDMKKLC
jgi:carotenoid cleavage dioxygenase-like enzyme